MVCFGTICISLGGCSEIHKHQSDCKMQIMSHVITCEQFDESIQSLQLYIAVANFWKHVQQMYRYSTVQAVYCLNSTGQAHCQSSKSYKVVHLHIHYGT